MNAHDVYQLGQRLERSGNPDREHPYYYSAEAIEAFTEHYTTARADELRRYVTGKQTPAVKAWLTDMADRAHDPELLHAWMKLALAGDAAGLLLAVSTFTTDWITSDTDEWIAEQITTGNWADILKEQAE